MTLTVSQAARLTGDFRRAKGLKAGDFDGRGSGELPKLRYYARHLLELAHELGTMVEADPRLYWAHLQVEELGERLMANSKGAAAEEEALDSLADSLYVLLGEADARRMPIEEAFKEVHRSNMTKQAAGPGDPRLAKKGPGYCKPDLAAVLKRARDQACVDCGYPVDPDRLRASCCRCVDCEEREEQARFEQARAIHDIERG